MLTAEVEQLRKYVATLEERVQNAEVDRDEWRNKAKSLASNFMSALKDLKSSLHSVKRDQKEGMQDLRNEFDGRLRTITQHQVTLSTHSSHKNDATINRSQQQNPNTL